MKKEREQGVKREMERQQQRIAEMQRKIKERGEKEEDKVKAEKGENLYRQIGKLRMPISTARLFITI